MSNPDDADTRAWFEHFMSENKLDYVLELLPDQPQVGPMVPSLQQHWEEKVVATSEQVDRIIAEMWQHSQERLARKRRAEEERLRRRSARERAEERAAMEARRIQEQERRFAYLQGYADALSAVEYGNISLPAEHSIGFVRQFWRGPLMDWAGNLSMRILPTASPQIDDELPNLGDGDCEESKGE